MISHDDEKYMRRCLQLARCGEAGAPPNPLVGAVIVHNGVIIGEGYHRQYGKPHAEVNAIAAVTRRELLPESTLYVNLEPCSHFGKTPPCCDLIIKHKIPRVVVGMTDPFAEVMGRGIERMRGAGIEVCIGICQNECMELNRLFIVSQLQQRPYVMLKWAQSADGYLDRLRTAGSPVVMSTPHTAMHVHAMRAAADAILVGRNTAELDDPQLDVRHWVGSSPIRVVLSPQAPLRSNLRVMQDGRPTLVIGPRTERVSAAVEFADARPLMRDDKSGVDIKALTSFLYSKGYSRLMVEGGGRVLSRFIESGIWDEAWVEISGMIIGEGIPAPIMQTGAVAECKMLWGVPHMHYTNPKSNV